jgi:hypothetical protein
MAYFPDLSPYAFRPFQVEVDPNLLNVGWLSRWRPFSEGSVDGDLLDTLLRLCRTPVNRTRGYHSCPFCGVRPMVMEIDSLQITLGSAEIRIPGKGKTVYAAPNLICHYIAKHGYRPPQEFLEAVAALPPILVR